MAIIDRIYLECKIDTSNKFYEVIIESRTFGATYIVKARYGRIGTKGTWIEKFATDHLQNARIAKDDLVFAKESKGYHLAVIETMNEEGIEKISNMSRFSNLE